MSVLPSWRGVSSDKQMSGITCSIRPITQNDEPAWRTLWGAYLDFYQTRLREEIYRTSFARLLDETVTDYHGLLAVTDRPVGLVHFIYHRHGWHLEPVTYLQDLFVDPDLRGNGIGRKLIEDVYSAADAAGAPSVYWMTQEFNTAGRRLYDKVGQRTAFIKYRRP